MASSANNKVVGNLVRWVKDTTIQAALTRNQFELVLAMCIEDNTYPSVSPVFATYVEDDINVSDIVDFILWGAGWVNTRKTTLRLLQAACALLENYKETALRLWPTAKAGDMAYRAIMFTMSRRGMEIIGDSMKYSLAMAAISILSSELLDPTHGTSSMFSQTSASIFNTFATELHMPNAVPRKKLHNQDEILDIIENNHATVSEQVSRLHIDVWGSTQYIQPCSDTLKLITKVSESFSLADVKHLYVAGMAISGLLASRQMISTALPDANVMQGEQYITVFLQNYAGKKDSTCSNVGHLNTSYKRPDKPNEEQQLADTYNLFQLSQETPNKDQCSNPTNKDKFRIHKSSPRTHSAKNGQ